MRIQTLTLAVLLSSILCENIACAVPSQPLPAKLSCTQLPTGSWDILGFATYKERQKDPKQNDISNFTISKVSLAGANGSVTTAGTTYSFAATCEVVNVAGYGDILALRFTAPTASLINGCSGLYSASPHAMYVGGPSLTSGYDNFSYCQTAQGKTGAKVSPYGVVAP